VVFDFTALYFEEYATVTIIIHKQKVTVTFTAKFEKDQRKSHKLLEHYPMLLLLLL